MIEGFDLTDRVCVVTGGSRGLGREMVLAFARAGADVMIVSRRLDACEALAEEVAAETGRRAVGHAAHVGRWAEVDALADAAYETFGRVDVLVNNAGKSPLYESVTDISEEMWDSVIGLNLKGPFRLAANVGTRMKAAGSGSIINVSSTGAIRPRPEILPYAAAKLGLHAVTEALAPALGPEVRVNCIMPGAFLTDISKAWDMEAFEERAQGFALRRGGAPHEIVGAALYLAGDASSYTTGAVIPVHGGYT